MISRRDHVRIPKASISSISETCVEIGGGWDCSGTQTEGEKMRMGHGSDARLERAYREWRIRLDVAKGWV
jgi:hypothetical protein